MSLASISDRRLRNQRLAGGAFKRPVDVVSWFGAVQAQEFEHAKWALALRMGKAADRSAIERAFDQGHILRTHVMRPTWHLVAPADIRWMQQLTGPRVSRIMSRYHSKIGIEAKLFPRTLKIIEPALRDRNYLTRDELNQRLKDAGVALRHSIQLAHVVMHAELEGVICSGPRRGKQSTYALVAERAPKAKTLPRDEALAELVKRYFQSHGPATTRDFAWWSGLTGADARRGLEIIRARNEDVNGVTYWSVSGARFTTGKPLPLYLLPIYDEFIVAYRDRAAVPHITLSWKKPVVFQHTLVISGQVAGTWRTPAPEKKARIAVIPSRRLTATERKSLETATRRYEAFVAR